MNLTFGFIAFFISVIIPGILFRRFFYYGEFSKQFDSKDPVLHSIFYSIVPGVCIQVICFILCEWLFSFDIENEEIFNIFKDFVYSGEKEINTNTKTFLNDDLSTFIYYSLAIFSISILSGHGIARLIRWTGWDKKYKILKFKNQWFYIFSGELLEFEKFELGNTITRNSSIPYNHKISTTYADVLVDNTEGMRELYTGYVVDYDLSSEDITQLERIYLLDTYRYKKIEKNDFSDDIETLCNDEINESNNITDSIEEQVEYKSRIRKKIPGDVFVVSGKNILNVNLTYVPSEKKHELREAKTQKRYRRLSNAYMLITLVVLITHFAYRVIGLKDTWFGLHIEFSNWISKTLAFIGFIQLFSLFVPSLSNDEQKYSYNGKKILAKIITFIVIYIILCLMQSWEWLSSKFPLWNPFL